jgi:hypothetical protein
VEAAGQAYPALHSPLQLAFGMADTAPYSPAAQSVHTPAPLTLYRPAGHTAAVALVDPATHAYPALQLASQEGVVSPDTDPYRPLRHGPLQLEFGMADIAPYRPALQLMQANAPARLYLPAGHTAALAFVEAAPQTYPALHSPLQLAIGMPDTAPYSPAAQSVHTLAPVKLYRPAGHTAAVALADPATHAYPALQFPVHSGVVRPLDDPYRPASQGPLQLMVGMADTAPYRPALQLVHTLAPGRLYLPAGHRIAVALVEAAGQAYPALHSPLQLAFGMADTAPYSPAAQSMHMLAPAKLCRPAGHSVTMDDVDPEGHVNPAVHGPSQEGDVYPAPEPKRPGAQGPVQEDEVWPPASPYLRKRPQKKSKALYSSDCTQVSTMGLAKAILNQCKAADGTAPFPLPLHASSTLLNRGQ